VNAADEQVVQFLRLNGLENARRNPIAGDASGRRYDRVTKGNQTFILMDAQTSLRTRLCDPLATPAQRALTGYDALARRSGGRVEAFVCLASWLRSQRLAAPDVFAFDASSGLALVEDLGDNLFAAMLDRGDSTEDAYVAAASLLAQLTQTPPPRTLNAGGSTWNVLEYDHTALIAESSLLLDWFISRQLGRQVSAAARTDWENAWRDVFAASELLPRYLVLRDYHSPNLIWLPERPFPQSVGLLDFQDALVGSPAFDLMSLLEDPRRDIPEEVSLAALSRFFSGSAADRDAFLSEYAVMSVQRSTKLIGIFHRLALAEQKPQYLRYVTRAIRQLSKHIRNPSAQPILSWLQSEAPEVLENYDGVI